MDMRFKDASLRTNAEPAVFRITRFFLAIVLSVSLSLPLVGCGSSGGQDEPQAAESVQELSNDSNEAAATQPEQEQAQEASQNASDGVENLVYEGKPSVSVGDGIPSFTAEELSSKSFEHYSELDSLGRCGQCFALVGTETMPHEKRGSIGMVKPTGWHLSKYDFVEGKYLYNRCHLIGFQLTGENANECNLITGTRYLNTEGMLPYENEVADYVDETGNHVLYRVTPDFRGEELVARGVRIEAQSVEDDGAGVCFDVYCFNVQPKATIDYRTGDNKRSGSAASSSSASSEDKNEHSYVLNTRSKVFHDPSCDSVDKMSQKNRSDVVDSRADLIDQGYKPCGRCNP